MKQTFFLLFLLQTLISSCSTNSNQTPATLDTIASKTVVAAQDSVPLPISIGEALPYFNLFTLDRQAVNSQTLLGHDADTLYIVFFHPECEDCKNFAKTLKPKNILHKGVTMWWISLSPDDSKIAYYQNTFFPDSPQEVNFYVLPDLTFQTALGQIIETPSIFTFSKGKFVKKQHFLIK